MTITTAQIRGARGLLDWSQAELSRRTGISTTSIGNIESGHTQARESTLAIIRKAFENSGISFIDGGVRQHEQFVQILEGPDANDRLLEDVFQTLRDTGGEILISGLEEPKDKNSDAHKKLAKHLDRLSAANITERILLQKGDTNFVAPKSWYKWVPKEHFSSFPFQLYGNKLAMINWGPPQKIIIVENNLTAQSFRALFDFAWSSAEIPS
ncbi:MAG: helix-turn-helix domain-containing protein [Proteobacteria bacterium]|nr:helix-turn-helix domain-containing protein [Pseudomonadota bacterium]